MIMYRTYSITPTDREKIMKALEIKGISLSGLAVLLKLSRQYIQQLLDGLRKIPITRIVEIQNILEINLEVENEF